VVKHLNLPDFFLSKGELMVLTEDLNMIRSLVSANFICLEKVDLLDILGNMEVPLSKSVIFQAMHRLISFDSKFIWVHVVDQAGYC
jgi:hypothetical protein